MKNCDKNHIYVIFVTNSSYKNYKVFIFYKITKKIDFKKRI